MASLSRYQELKFLNHGTKLVDAKQQVDNGNRQLVTVATAICQMTPEVAPDRFDPSRLIASGFSDL